MYNTYRFIKVAGQNPCPWNCNNWRCEFSIYSRLKRLCEIWHFSEQSGDLEFANIIFFCSSDMFQSSMLNLLVSPYPYLYFYILPKLMCFLITSIFQSNFEARSRAVFRIRIPIWIRKFWASMIRSVFIGTVLDLDPDPPINKQKSWKKPWF